MNNRLSTQESIAMHLQDGQKIPVNKQVRIYVESTSVFVSEVKMLKGSVYVKIEKIDGAKSDSAVKPLSSLSEQDQVKILDYLKSIK